MGQRDQIRWFALCFLGGLFIAMVLAVRAELRDARLRQTTLPGTPYRTREDSESSPPPSAPRSRRFARALLIALLCAPLSPAWIFATGDTMLPVTRPLSPVPNSCDADPGASAMPLDFVVILIAFFVAYLVLRFAPALIMYWLDRRRPATPAVPSGDHVLLVALVASALVMIGAAARMTLGDTYDPRTFTVYGAITPTRASGKSIERIVSRSIAKGSTLAPLAHGDDAPEDVERFPGSDMGFPPSMALRRGLHAWVGSIPVLIDTDAHGTPRIRTVEFRAADFPEGGRPHFDHEPLWARCEPYGTLLVEHRDDGSTFAMHVDGDGAFATSFPTVGMIVEPPLWPIGWVVLTALVGSATLWTRRRGSFRIAAAWAMTEGLIVFALVWAPYLPR